MSIVLVAGCAGNGEGLDGNGRPADPGAGGGLTADFESIQTNVLTPICTNCHSGAAAPLGLRLDEGASFALLVNAPSTEVPSAMRVAPGNPDASYLIQKLEGTAPVGGRMPLGGSPLPAETIAIIRQWILEGALGPLSDAGAPQLSAAWPIEGGVLLDDAALVLAADRELDTSLFSAGTLVMTRSGGDGDFANGNEVDVAVRATVRSVSPTVLALHIPINQTWLADQYRLRASGGAPLAIVDLGAAVLDGDADGLPGGDFELNFTVEQHQ